MFVFVICLASAPAGAICADDFKNDTSGKLDSEAGPPRVAIFSTAANASIAGEAGGNNYGNIREPVTAS